MEVDQAVELNRFGEIADENLNAMELAFDNPDAPRNREGHVVVRGQLKCSNKWYCGLRKGQKQIPGSDGRCGPTNGPQCEACKAFQIHNPIENQFAHLAMNEGQLFREARDLVQGPIDLPEELPDVDPDDDEVSVKTASPRYPERMLPELVTELTDKKFPTDPQTVIKECTREGGILYQPGMEKMVKILGASCYNGNNWGAKQDNRMTVVVKLLGRNVDGVKCRGCDPHQRCGEVAENNSTSFRNLSCGCEKKLAVGLLTVHKDIQCREEHAPAQAAHARKVVENEKEYIRNSGFRVVKDLHYASASLTELEEWLKSFHVLWVMGGNVNHGIDALRATHAMGVAKWALLEEAILSGRIAVVGNSAGAMMWSSRLDSNRDKDQHLLGDNWAGFGFFADLTVVPHTSTERLEHHHRQNRETTQRPLVFDPAGEMPNRVAPLVDQMGLLRVGTKLCYVYQNLEALKKRRRFAAVSSFPSNYVTADTISADFEKYPPYTVRMALLDEALAAEEDAVATERERCRAEAEQRENELHEWKMQTIREAATAAAVARAAAETVRIEQERLDALKLAKEKDAAQLKEQIELTNGQAKADAKRASRAAAKVAEEARLEACAAQDKLRIKMEEADRADQFEQEQKDNLGGLQPEGPEYLKRLVQTKLEVALAIIRIDPTWTKGRGIQTYPVKCRLFCQFLKDIELHEKRGAIQFHEMADLTPEDMESIKYMIQRSNGRLKAAYHREGFRDVHAKARIYGSVTITYHTAAEDYTKPPRKRHGASNKKNYSRKPEVIMPCDQNHAYVQAKNKLDEVRLDGTPIDEQLPIKDGNIVRQVMNDMDDLTHATKGPEWRATAKRKAKVERACDEAWVAEAEERLQEQLDKTSWIKPEHLPSTEAEVQVERNIVLAQLCELAGHPMYANNDLFRGDGFLDLKKRIKVRIPKPSHWTIGMMQEANENARQATSIEPLLDKLQPPAPGLDVNSIKLWYTGRYVIVVSLEEDLRRERSRLGEQGLERELEDRALFYKEAQKVGELTLAYRRQFAESKMSRNDAPARQAEADRAQANADEQMEVRDDATQRRKRKQEAEREERAQRDRAEWRDDHWRGGWHAKGWNAGWNERKQWTSLEWDRYNDQHPTPEGELARREAQRREEAMWNNDGLVQALLNGPAAPAEVGWPDEAAAPAAANPPVTKEAPAHAAVKNENPQHEG